jgi:hypothetical protein
MNKPDIVPEHRDTHSDHEWSDLMLEGLDAHIDLQPYHPPSAEDPELSRPTHSYQSQDFPTGSSQDRHSQTQTSTLFLRYAIPSKRSINPFRSSSYVLSAEGQTAVSQAWEAAIATTQQEETQGLPSSPSQGAGVVPVCFSLESLVSNDGQGGAVRDTRPVALSVGAWRAFRRALKGLELDGMISLGSTEWGGIIPRSN